MLAAAGWAERERNADEEYGVYSAYLSEGLLNDAHDWSVGGPVHVVVRDTTEVGENLRWRLLYSWDSHAQFHQLRTSTRASYLVRNLFRTRIASKFVLPSGIQSRWLSLKSHAHGAIVNLVHDPLFEDRH